MTAFKAAVSVCVLVGLLAASVLAVNIETVPVGNAGNAPDTRYASPGYGSVAYTYNIGKYLVTAAQYTEFLNAVAATDTYGLYNPQMDINSGISGSEYACNIKRHLQSGRYTYSVAADYANRPVNFVGWNDAARFANWLHNGQPTGPQGPDTTETGAYTLNGTMTIAEIQTVERNADWKWAIPTEDEWYKAAYHKNDGMTGNYWDYPTNSNSLPGRDLNDTSGNNANYYTPSGPYPIDSSYYTTVVGEFQNSASPYGTFDQGGNVYEWNEAVIDSGRGLRGGSFWSYWNTLQASFRLGGTNPYSTIYYRGFRVVQVPEPTSLAILALGGVAMLRRRGLGR